MDKRPRPFWKLFPLRISGPVDPVDVWRGFVVAVGGALLFFVLTLYFDPLSLWRAIQVVFLSPFVWAFWARHWKLFGRK